MTLSLKAPANLKSPASVRVWTFTVPSTGLDPDVARLASMISDDERGVAARRAPGRPRTEYLTTRIAVRCLLAGQLGERPADLRFTATPDGKPELVGHDLHFNVSHSHRLGLLAVSSTGPVGVDVEYLDTAMDVDALAPRVCSARELHCFTRAGSRRRELFFRYWTCKESYLKAVGCGLRRPPAQVQVQLAGWGVGSGRAQLAGDTAWSVRELVPAARYVAAVTTREPLSRLHLSSWLDAAERGCA